MTMPSDQAHGWLFVDLINVHLSDHTVDEWDKLWLHNHGKDPDAVWSSFCPECCGPCHALRDYWNTPRGRAEAQTYVNQLGPEARNWTWCPNGVIDWTEIEDRMAHGFCPNHESKE